MENKPSYSGESLWCRGLPEAELAALRTQPELAAEAQLTDALAKISNIAVPSNFTARVLAAIELEEAQVARTHGGHWNWRALWPRLAVAMAVLIFAGVSVQRYEAGAQRAALAKTIAIVASTPAVPSVEALNNFDAIQRMSQRADDQLIALMQ